MYLFSLIKSGKIHTSSTSKIIPKDDYQSLLDSMGVLEEAKKERERLLEETRKECDELRKQAEAQGFQRGLEMFNEQILGLESSIKHQRHELQSQILPLALKASKRIVGEELSSNPEAIVNIIQQAIKPATSHSQIKIYVNKDDLAMVMKSKEAIRERFEKLESLTIAERADVTPGSCIIETEVGIINATLENQWRALEAAFENYQKQK